MIVSLGAAMILLLGACASDAVEQTEVVAVAPTSVATTAPLSVPTPTPAPPPAAASLPEATSAPLPTATVAPTAVPTPTLDPVPSPTAVSAAAPVPTVAPTATVETETVETPTPVPTATAEPDAAQDSDSEADPDVDTESTPVAETPTAEVVLTGEPPLECYDSEVRVYRAFVDGVDALSFEQGRVYCSGAGTNAVSASGSYRHSSGLIVQRNADYIFNDEGTAYIPYSGSLHFCLNGQPASASIRAETVPSLLVVIDNEAQRQLAQGAIRPAAFTSSGTQC